MTKEKKKSVLYLTAALSGGNYYAMVMHMVAGIVIGRYVEPGVLGKFGAFSLVLGYIPFAQLGILNGLNRELPYYIGRGEGERVNTLASAAQFWACALGGIVGAVLLVLSLFYAVIGNFENALGWAVHAILAFLLFYNTYYLQMTYRTSHDFARLAISKVFESTASVVLIVMVVWWGFYGLCIKALLVAFVSLGILYWWRPIRVLPRWDWSSIKHLFSIGCPIFIVGQIYSYWGVIVSTCVLATLGKTGMGLYTIVVMSLAAMETVPKAVSQIVYPRMAQAWGEKEDIGNILKVAIKPILLMFLGLIPILVLANYLVGPAIEFLLPKYVAAIPAVKWSIWISLICTLDPITNVFNVVRRQRLYLALILTGMIATFVSIKVLIVFEGNTLAVFPQSMLIGKTVFMALCYFVIYRIWKRGAMDATNNA